MSGNLPKIDLLAQESAGGHTIARHVGKDPLWLANRLASDPAIRIASSFADLPSAEHHVSAAVYAHFAAYQQWLSGGPGSIQQFDYDAATKTGYGLVRGVPGVMSMSKVRVIIRRMPNPPQMCFVLTAFPIL